MNLTTNQLRYILEIYNSRSISKAAGNLFMAQSNLSRILSDTEDNIGYKIFDRSRQGIYPTEQGKLFLAKAERILNDVSDIESIGHSQMPSSEINICIPHSYSSMNIIMDFFSNKKTVSDCVVNIDECASTKTIDNISSGSADVGIIRIFSDHQSYYKQRIEENNIAATLLSTSHFQIVVAKTSPLASLEKIDPSNLGDYTCIASMHKKSASRLSNSRMRISVTDRLSQIKLLSAIEKSFLWAEPLPADLLEEYGLVQISTIDPVYFQTYLISRQTQPTNPIISELMQWICKKS